MPEIFSLICGLLDLEDKFDGKDWNLGGLDLFSGSSDWVIFLGGGNGDSWDKDDGKEGEGEEGFSSGGTGGTTSKNERIFSWDFTNFSVSVCFDSNLLYSSVFPLILHFSLHIYIFFILFWGAPC